MGKRLRVTYDWLWFGESFAHQLQRVSTLSIAEQVNSEVGDFEPDQNNFYDIRANGMKLQDFLRNLSGKD